MRDSDEINVLEYLYALIKCKWLLLLAASLGYIGGNHYANLIGPVYVGDATIINKEAEAQNNNNVSGLGMFGSIVANQLSIGGIASLKKIELLLDSRSFHTDIVKEKKLLPVIYSDIWDSVNEKWDSGLENPSFESAGGFLKGHLEKEINKNGTMTIKIVTEDSLKSYKILSVYLEYLDEYVRKSVQEDAKENRDYLEQQIVGITDPLLQAKIQDLISKEVEKMMVVSKEAFKIIDPVLVYKTFKEKRRYPLIFSSSSFAILSLIIIIFHAIFSANKTEDDKKLIADIRKEIFKIPFVANKKNK